MTAEIGIDGGADRRGGARRDTREEGVLVPAKRRDLGVESLRAIAIVLMVAGHVIGDVASAGMQVADDSWWRFSYLGLLDIRMPLFTTLSGFVYAYRPVTRGFYSSMIKGKARRLLVPLVTVGPLFFFTRSLVPGTNGSAPLSEVWRVPVLGYGHFWFVEALFLIFVVTGLLDLFGVLDRGPRWAGVTALAVLLYVAGVPFGFTVFSVDEAFRLLPFFLIGYGVHRYGGTLTASASRWVPILLVFLAAYSIRLAELFGPLQIDAVLTRTAAVGVGATAVVLLMIVRSFLVNRYLAWLGQFAFGVYLLHVFGAAGARVMLGRLGVDDDGVIFVVALALAVGLPVAFEMTLGRVRWISWTFLGQRPWRPNRPRDFAASPGETRPMPRSDAEVDRLQQG